MNSLKDRQEALISERDYEKAKADIAAELAGMDEAQSLKIKRRIETRQLADKVIELFKWICKRKQLLLNVKLREFIKDVA